MGCMPYGLALTMFASLAELERQFQSLIWVACPTGHNSKCSGSSTMSVSIPHMGCMPYGRDLRTRWHRPRGVSIPHMGCMPYGLKPQQFLVRTELRVSIPHMGCMPYGQCTQFFLGQKTASFNPSYGLHALRAQNSSSAEMNSAASFNPSYGLHALRA